MVLISLQLYFGKQHGNIMLAKGWNENGGNEEKWFKRLNFVILQFDYKFCLFN